MFSLGTSVLIAITLQLQKFSGKRPAYIYPGNLTAAVPYTTTGTVGTTAADITSMEGRNCRRIQCLTDLDSVG